MGEAEGEPEDGKLADGSQLAGTRWVVRKALDAALGAGVVAAGQYDLR